MLGEGDRNMEESDVTTKVLDGVGVWDGKEISSEEEDISSSEVGEGDRGGCDTDVIGEGEGVSDGCVISCEDEAESSTTLEVMEGITVEVDGVADGRATDEVLGRTTGTAGRQP